MANQTTTTASTQGSIPWYSQWQNTYGTSGSPGTGVTSGYSISNAVYQTATNGASQWQFADAGTFHSSDLKTGNLTASGTVELTGEDADIVINGVRLSDSLNAINERLNILHTNRELEADWADLAELGRQYREKEAWVKERVKLLDILAKD